MAKCSNCSAPLPPNTIKCDYCGSRNDTDLKGIHHYTTHEIESERTCPRCSVSLRTIDLKIQDKFLIERCDDCLGLFFDPGELEALLEASVKNVFDIKRGRFESINKTLRNTEYGVNYIKCPVCSNIMNRINFGTKSGVIIDRCKDHGVWLDGGELRHLFEWMKAGGKLLHQERKEEIKKEKLKKEEKEARKKAMEGSGSDTPLAFSSYGSTLRRSDPDLFGLVKTALRRIF